MTDDEFEKEVQDLVELLNSLHLIKDKGRTKWLKKEIRAQLIRILNGC